MARFKGWNFDPRWQPAEPEWLGTHYTGRDDPITVAKAGQRPIVAFVGGDHDILAVQFVETNNEIVGKFLTFAAFYVAVFHSLICCLLSPTTPSLSSQVLTLLLALRCPCAASWRVSATPPPCW